MARGTERSWGSSQAEIGQPELQDELEFVIDVSAADALIKELQGTGITLAFLARLRPCAG